ncbi:diphosphomevalonate decarboxylase [Candidatus Roizmanbacteria bacterium RIFCSPLOWO2_01_FULL_35_13]|uniref:diphosphomevalonate decarboxylase n=1 Tax=Candidatus Roizmanbacteria bacterium RIFCSPLOWO2_01_FULL_35_13 TaxID=1802055 RepID=A0A1F7IGZ5_9BACT|nr:MAG: diphosphomevalonate decarboxylase [Candidatus Roizmanbacteria bacterium RIFCSPLOWO2_01_FULL_35_13]
MIHSASSGLKATAVAPSNIAFIKYWGKKDEKLRLPVNGSVSMNLSNLLTTTTVEFDSSFKSDGITIDGKKELGVGLERVVKQLDRVRNIANIKYKANIISKNNFPRGTGLSSSASGFAALTLAASKAAGLNLNEKVLSILARQGSGSACRSIPDGFVEWMDGNSSETSFSVSIFPPEHWNILDIVVITSREKKNVLTTEGQKLAKSSLFFPVRVEKIKEKINQCKKLVREKKFTEFGELIEAEALELHAIMLTSIPSLIYWLPMTVKLMHAIKQWRKDGIESYFTVNTGQNMHIIAEEKNKDLLINRLKGVKGIYRIVINKPAKGARLISEHLF